MKYLFIHEIWDQDGYPEVDHIIFENTDQIARNFHTIKNAKNPAWFELKDVKNIDEVLNGVINKVRMDQIRSDLQKYKDQRDQANARIQTLSFELKKLLKNPLQ